MCLTKKRRKIINTFDKRTAYLVNTFLLVVHFSLLISYFIIIPKFNTKMMIYANILSVTVYMICYIVIRYDLYTFVKIVFYEIFAHMIVSTILVGWEFGYQFYSVCLISVVFILDYIKRTQEAKAIHPIITSSIVVAVTLGLKIFVYYRPWYIYIDDTLFILMISILNASSNLGFMVFYMTNYVEFTLNIGHMAVSDELTKLRNRHGMRAIMEREERAAEDEMGHMAIAMIDIDDFKLVNDNYGHNAGDLILIGLAETIRKLESENMFACRWGGEEFLVLSTGENAYGNLKGRINELIEDIGKRCFHYGEYDIYITVTAGAARRRKGENTDHLIGRADAYLYEGKQSGKNRLVAKD
jgi:diguanylate cyclase (GGDEF)-like protein